LHPQKHSISDGYGSFQQLLKEQYTNIHFAKPFMIYRSACQ